MTKKAKEVIGVIVLGVLLYLIACTPIMLGVWDRGWEFLDTPYGDDPYGKSDNSGITPRQQLWLGLGITIFCVIFLIWVLFKKNNKD